MSFNSISSVNKNAVFFDNKSELARFWEIVTEHPVPPIITVFAALLILIVPGLFLVAILLVFIFRLAFKLRPDTLPFFLPHHAKNKVDKNNHQIGKSGFKKPEGHIFWGVCMETGMQLWAKFESALRHVLVLGTTGAGKTEMLLGILTNFLCVGGGSIYNDGKGTVKLYYQIFSIARFLGREDHVLLVNFMKENTAKKHDPAAIISHSIAPYSFGSSDNNTQLTTSLMSDEGGAGQNKVFSEGAMALIAAVMPALCDLRELGVLNISPKVIRKFTNYPDYCVLMRNPLISESSRESMLGFVRSRSGYDDKKPADAQPDEVTKQWGYNQAYFARALQMLSDIYSNIYMYDTGEVDYRDVVLNDRILTCILPSMSKSTAEMGQLGKMNLFAIRGALSLGLGGDIEGTVADVLETNVTSSDRPSVCINDEIAYYLAPGFMITAAQARGLMWVMVFSSQEFASIKNANATEAEQAWANTRWKHIMASEGDNETIPRLQQLAGEVWAYVRSGLTFNNSSLLGGHIGKSDISLQKVSNFSIDEIRSLKEGQGIAFYESKKVKTQYFHYGITEEDYASQLRVLTCPDPIIAPPRGAYKDILSTENYQSMLAVRDWLKNFQRGDYEEKEIKLSQKLNVAVNYQKYVTNIGQNISGFDSAKLSLISLHAFNNAFRLQESMDHGAAESNGSLPLLGNLSGSLGNTDFKNNLSSRQIISMNSLNDVVNEIEADDDGFSIEYTSDKEIESKLSAPQTADEIIRELVESSSKQSTDATRSILSYLNDDDGVSSQPPIIKSSENTSTSVDTQMSPPIEVIHDEPENSTSVFDSSAAEESHLDGSDFSNFEMDQVSPRRHGSVAESLLRNETIERISKSTAQLEIALGSPEAHANASAKQTVSDVVNSVSYPKEGMPKGQGKEKLNTIRAMLDKHIQQSKKP